MFGLSGLKLIAIAATAAVLIGLPSYAAWQLSAYRTQEAAQADTDRQVTAVREKYTALLDAQKALTEQYRGLADEKYAELAQRIDKIKVTHTTLTKNITIERESNPAFYSQPLPEGGRQQWLDARAIFR